MTDYFARLDTLRRPTSMAAVWCQRLAVFAVPYLIITVLGHRFGAIDTQSTFWLLGIGFVLLVISLLAGARGYYELWTYGHRAGMNSTRGMFLAGILVVPYLYLAVQAFALPPLFDVSTDLDDPPAFDTALDDRSSGMNPILDPVESAKRRQLEAYPRLAARRYPLDTARVFTEVVDLVGEQDWTILTSNTVQGESRIDDEGSGLIAKPTVDSRGLPLRIPEPIFRPQTGPTANGTSSAAADQPIETVQISPIGRTSDIGNEDQEERYVEAVATSLIFGFESDVVIRMVEADDGTIVDMRSTSRWGPHDLGSNAARIIGFLAELDTALQGISR